MELKVRNWDKFQHYKARRPPWIKLHRALLEDRAFLALPLAAQALAPRLWLLASETDDGSLSPDPADLAFRLRCSEAELVPAVNALIAGKFLSGLLDVASAPLAPCVHVATPETEVETETEERQRQIPAASPPVLALVAASDWNREAADDFQSAYGKGVSPNKAFFASVKAVARKHGWQRTRPALQAYMAETPIEFLNVAKCLESKVVNGAGVRGSPPSRAVARRLDGLRAAIEGGMKGDGT